MTANVHSRRDIQSQADVIMILTGAFLIMMANTNGSCCCCFAKFHTFPSSYALIISKHAAYNLLAICYFSLPLFSQFHLFCFRRCRHYFYPSVYFASIVSHLILDIIHMTRQFQLEISSCVIQCA